MINANVYRGERYIQSGFNPIGLHDSELNPITVQTIPITDPRITHMICQAQGGAIWITFDGVDPVVGSHGFILSDAQLFHVIPVNFNLTLKVITADSGDFQYQFVESY